MNTTPWKDNLPKNRGYRTGRAALTWKAVGLTAGFDKSAGDRLDWKCGSRTDDIIWRQFDCDWEGAHLRPGNFSLREAKDVSEVSKDLWIDSLEISQASARHLTSVEAMFATSSGCIETPALCQQYKMCHLKLELCLV